MTKWGPSAALALTMAGLLSACASNPGGGGAPGRHAGPTVTPSGAKIGAPYQIDGIWYYPQEDRNYDKVGIASWYGDPFDGRPTAIGEIYDMNALTAAHTTLPLPSNVEVTNLENGRSLVLRVNDRGPFVNGRIIDVSRRAAQLLGFEQQGTTEVRVRVLPDAGSNTMLASAPGPSVNSRAVVASMPAGNTELLAAPRGGAPGVTPAVPPVRAQPVVRVAMAPIPDAAPSAAQARMAPIPDPAPARMAPIPDPEPQRPIFTAGNARAYPSDTVGSDAVFTPTEGFAQDEAAPGPDQGDRTLASLLPAGAASGSMRSRAVEARPIEAPQRPAAPRYAAMAPRGDAVSPARFGPIGSAAHARANPPVAMRWVAGPAPAVILSDASSGEGAQSYDGGPTLQPTLASVRSSQPAPQQAARSFDAAGRSGGVYIQAGAFLSDRNAEALRAQLASYGRADVLTTNVGGKLFHRVRIGPMASASEAERALAKLRQIGHPEAHIVPQ